MGAPNPSKPYDDREPRGNGRMSEDDCCPLCGMPLMGTGDGDIVCPQGCDLMEEEEEQRRELP